ncbi:MAG: hypothetical protein JNG88_10840 [Phycisphaerales bacterium]|nr:hypothetical protein [Phycisphaerales bacterium]
MVVDTEVSELQKAMESLKARIVTNNQVTVGEIAAILDAIVILGKGIRDIDAAIYNMKTGGTTYR